MLLRKLNCARNKRVLWRTIDEWCTLECTGNRKYCGGRDFLVSVFNGFQQILGRVVDPSNNISISFCVGSPEHDNFLKVVLHFELSLLWSACAFMCRMLFLPDILADLINMSHACVLAWKNVVRTVLLVGRNKVRVVNAWKWLHKRHFFVHHLL